MAVDLFAVELLGKPFWLWLLFLGIVLGLLAFDLGVLHRRTREVGRFRNEAQRVKQSGSGRLCQARRAVPGAG
jgi:hypothetical protein